MITALLLASSMIAGPPGYAARIDTTSASTHDKDFARTTPNGRQQR